MENISLVKSAFDHVILKLANHIHNPKSWHIKNNEIRIMQHFELFSAGYRICKTIIPELPIEDMWINYIFNTRGKITMKLRKGKLRICFNFIKQVYGRFKFNQVDIICDHVENTMLNTFSELNPEVGYIGGVTNTLGFVVSFIMDIPLSASHNLTLTYV